MFYIDKHTLTNLLSRNNLLLIGLVLLVLLLAPALKEGFHHWYWGHPYVYRYGHPWWRRSRWRRRYGWRPWWRRYWYWW
jgi:hypothetical protein